MHILAQMKSNQTIKSNKMNKKIGIISLGCAKNLINTEQMMFLLTQAGFKVSGETENVDAVVINTCGFIDAAKIEAIDTILEIADAKAQGLVKKLVVAGCLSQRYKDEILHDMPEIDAVIGTGSYDEIVTAVLRIFNGEENVAIFDDINREISEVERVITASAAWAYVKIAEGCDNHCAYCVIPSLRGKFRSRSMDNIYKEVKKLAESGVKEVILVAQDLTRYGYDLYGESKLADLLELLSDISELEWIRLHYLYPDDIDEKLVDIIVKKEKILKYLDIPIQHINSGVLKKMNRRGSCEEIIALFKYLRSAIPGLVIRTSLIVGLPGEGDEQFEELACFLQDAKIERVGLFAYSPEDGTAAALMNRPESETVRRRIELLENIQSRIMDEYNISRIGQTVKLLVEGEENGRFYGRTYAESPEVDGYVIITGEKLVIGEMCCALITEIEDGQLVSNICGRGEEINGIEYS